MSQIALEAHENNELPIVRMLDINLIYKGIIMRVLKVVSIISLLAIPVFAADNPVDFLTTDVSKLSVCGLLAAIAGGALWLMYRLSSEHVKSSTQILGEKIENSMGSFSKQMEDLTRELRRLNDKLNDGLHKKG